jgi:hypothetical protein
VLTPVPAPPPLDALFRRTPVVDLQALRRALQTTSRTTVFRALRPLDYLTSYSHGGRYYTLRRIPRFDAHGLWWQGDIGFSAQGTLRKTLVELVETAPAGQTHDELQPLVRLRVHDTLRWLVARGLLSRRPWQRASLYLSARPEVADAQWQRRQERAAPTALVLDAAEVIDVLVHFIQHPDDHPADIARHLRGAGHRVSVEQVEALFARYDLKRGLQTSRRSRRSVSRPRR